MIKVRNKFQKKKKASDKNYLNYLFAVEMLKKKKEIKIVKMYLL